MELQGIWWNEIGCKMEIEMDSADPETFRGAYHSNFGSPQEKNCPLLGRCDNRGLATKMLAFVVVWDSADPRAIPDPVNPSVTAWCGRLQVVDGEEVIATAWIRTGSAHSPMIGNRRSWAWPTLQGPGLHPLRLMRRTFRPT